LQKTSSEAVAGIPTARVKADFPTLVSTGVTYLDSAATSQTPQPVLDVMDEYYERCRATVHRGLYDLANEATRRYNYAHVEVAKHIGAEAAWNEMENDVECELVFTSGTTQSINLVAESLARGQIGAGDRIVITALEHHSNLVPWQRIAVEKHAELKYVEFDSDGKLDLAQLEELVNERTKVVAVAHVSNFLGTVNDVKTIAEIAHKRDARLVVDGAQSVPHAPVDVKELGCDFLAFSGHKMCGPTGIGALFGRKELLEKMEPYEYGGDMMVNVRRFETIWNHLPWKFEAGTPKIAEGIGLGEACRYLQRFGMEEIRRHEIEITGYALKRLAEVPRLRLFGPTKPEERGGLVAFVFGEKYGKDSYPHAHDIGDALGQRGICIRVGHHCSMVAHQTMGITASGRASFYLYNNRADIDKLVDSLIEFEKSPPI
jgi:cysteine desulfurase / selenocysteine lyase